MHREGRGGEGRRDERKEREGRGEEGVRSFALGRKKEKSSPVLSTPTIGQLSLA